MGAADSYFERHAFFGREAAGDLDAQIRKRGEEVLVVAAHRVTPLMMFAPRFIVVPCTAAKGGHDPGQVVRVLSTDVFLHEGYLGADAVTEKWGHDNVRCSEIAGSYG